MSRGGSYGGGKSSLSYLFEPPEESTDQVILPRPKEQAQAQAGKHATGDEANRTAAATVVSKPGEKSQTEETGMTKVVPEGKSKNHTSNQNAIHFYTGRPSTKVNSVPGGRSSLGYLFGDS